ncbi:MAG: hypothetical protein AABX04_03690 [Nanoarchaeota archaeon]
MDEPIIEEKGKKAEVHIENHERKIIGWIKRREWQDWTLLGIIAFLLIINFLLTSPLKQLPSPIYGGDYYHQLGSTFHISSSINPFHWFESANVIGALPMQLPVYGVSVSLLVWIFGLNPMSAEFAFSYIIIILSSFLIYILANKLIKDKTISLLVPLAFIPIGFFPIIKYSLFTQLVTIPLFFISLINFYHKVNLKNSIWLGISFGLASLSHGVAFIAVSWTSVIVFADRLLFQFRKDKKFNWEEIKLFWKEKYLYFVIMGVIGFSLALCYWWKPIFIYHGQTKLGDQDWSMASLSLIKVQLDTLFYTLKNYLFNFSNIRAGILTLLLYPGLFVLFLSKNKEYTRLLKVMLLAGVTIVFSYFVTQPLLNTNFVPSQNERFLLIALLSITSFVGLKYLVNLSLFTERNLKYFLIFAVLILLSVSAVKEYNIVKEDQWHKAGMQEMSPHYQSLQKYLLENTDVDDIILSTNEISFAVNALTGRKIVNSRRGHNDKFLDFDAEEIKAAIILYGNDTQKKIELIKSKNIKYLYWDFYWIPSEYTFDEKGSIINWYDPLVFRYPEQYGPILEKNEIKYFQQHTWLDPGARYEDVVKYDLLFVSPDNYRSAEKPWKADLDPYLEEVWNYQQNGQKIAVLYKINIK